MDTSFKKEGRSDIETWSINRVVNKERFNRKVCRKCTTKTVPRPFFNFLSSPKQLLHTRNLKIRYFERGLSRNLEKVNLIFPFAPTIFFLRRL